MMESEQPPPIPRQANSEAKTKDPRKQEAGRKGAEVRRAKLEALKAELASEKEKVYSEHTERIKTPDVAVKMTADHQPSPSVEAEPRPHHPPSDTFQSSTMWLAGIGLTLVATFLWYKKPAAPAPTATLFAPRTPSLPPQQMGGRPPSPSLGGTRSVFDME
jgi:hypothetical protein